MRLERLITTILVNKLVNDKVIWERVSVITVLLTIVMVLCLTGTVITVLEQGVLLLHRSGAPDAANPLLLCNGMVVPSTLKRMASLQGKWWHNMGFIFNQESIFL